MKKNLYLAFCFVLLFQNVHTEAQEQVSFNYEKLNYQNYSELELYQHEDESRVLSVERNGEIVISRLNQNLQDTILVVAENQTDLPYTNRLNGDYLVQYYENKIVIVNIKTLNVDIKELDEAQGYYHLLVGKHYTFYRGAQDSIYQAIHLDDLSTYEIPSGYLSQINDSLLLNSYYNNPPKPIVLYNIFQETYDTIYPSTTDLSVLIADGNLYITDSLEVFKYTISTGTQELVHTYESDNNNHLIRYQEDLIFYENKETTSLLKITDLEGQNAQTYELNNLFDNRINEIFLKAENGDLIFRNALFKPFRIVEFDSIVPIDFGFNPKVFAGVSDTSVLFTQSNFLKEYQPDADEVVILDSIHISSNAFFDDLSFSQGQYYLRYEYSFFNDYLDTEGMEEVSYRLVRPRGFTNNIRLLQTEDNLYIDDDNDLFVLEEDSFQRMDSISFLNNPIEFNGELFFTGRVHNDLGLHKVSTDNQTTFVDNKARFITKTEDEDYLLVQNVTSLSVTTYSALKAGEDETSLLEYMPNIRFDFVDASLGSIVYLESEEQDTTTVWRLDLKNNSISPVFTCDYLYEAVVVDDKVVFHLNDWDGKQKLFFNSPFSDSYEQFEPTSVGENYHIGIFQLNCNQNSLLLEIGDADCSYIEIWSTDATLDNTKIQLTNAAPVERGFGDFAIHKEEDGLFFSIKTAENTYDHYRYDCNSTLLEEDPYPSDLVLTNRFQAGNSTFGISIKDPVNDRSLIDITDPSDFQYLSPLDKFRNTFEVVGIGHGYMFNTSQGLNHGNTTSQLAVLNIAPFGQEMYYVHEDGTYELLFDLNPGIADAFLPQNVILDPNIKAVKIKIHEDYLYFDAFTRDEGHQMYRIPAEDFISSVEETALVDSFSMKLFPNPTQDFINIEVPSLEEFEWIIYDQNGKRLRSGIGNSNLNNLNITNLRAGVYYFNINLEGRQFVKPFVKL